MSEATGSAVWDELQARQATGSAVWDELLAHDPSVAAPSLAPPD